MWTAQLHLKKNIQNILSPIIHLPPTLPHPFTGYGKDFKSGSHSFKDGGLVGVMYSVDLRMLFFQATIDDGRGTLLTTPDIRGFGSIFHIVGLLEMKVP